MHGRGTVGDVGQASMGDKWAAWVLARSHAGDFEQKRRSLRYLEPIRDKVLSNARVGTGDVVLDVGAGDGLIAFAAIPLVGSEPSMMMTTSAPRTINRLFTPINLTR